jgi:predicted DNA-binding transcriptional regulator YafY|tara:strand:- start:1901 stop:2572 length:672 start_codon:yes stop_codon:yes gene_type:complete
MLRLFALLDKLRAARRPVSAEVLAARLGVSSRTIYRDIASLQSIGAPIRGESGIGYQLEQGYFLPPLQFDSEEMEAIMLGMRHLIARQGGGLREAAERVTGKVAAALGVEGGEQFRNLNLLAVTRQRRSDQLADEWGSLVRLAIRNRRILELAYLSLDERESTRCIHPLGLTLFDDVWLLTAWCEISEDFRNFRLDRIKALAETGETFRLSHGKRFDDYLASL